MNLQNTSLYCAFRRVTCRTRSCTACFNHEPAKHLVILRVSADNLQNTQTHRGFQTTQTSTDGLPLSIPGPFSKHCCTSHHADITLTVWTCIWEVQFRTWARYTCTTGSLSGHMPKISSGRPSQLPTMSDHCS